jgi:hypothetical protein
MARTTMAALISRVRALLGGDTVLTDDQVQTFLDDHAIVVDSYLTPRPPFYTEHVSPFENLETGVSVYFGYNTLLIITTDYTIDLQRGIVTTVAADRRGLKVLGYAYDIHAAAGDGWDSIAARVWDEFTFSDVEGSYQRQQQYDNATKQAARERAKAWAVNRSLERNDTAALAPNDWRGDLIRRERAGYGPA